MGCYIITVLVAWVFFFLGTKMINKVENEGAPRALRIIMLVVLFIPAVNVVLALAWFVLSIVVYLREVDDDDLPNIKFFG